MTQTEFQQQEAKKQCARNTHNVINDWHICPRCKEKAVDRQNRKCLNCKGALLFPGDDGREYDKQMDYYWIWHKSSSFLVESWFPKEYFQ